MAWPYLSGRSNPAMEKAPIERKKEKQGARK
jgi:hypothetical protein